MASVESALRDQIQKKRVALIQLKHDIEAMERTLVIMQQEGQDSLTPQQLIAVLGAPSPAPTASPRKNKIQQGSIPDHVRTILLQSGKPLSVDQIMEALTARGKRVTRISAVGSLYRLAKKKVVFRLVRPGVFGLLEWPEEEDGHDLI